MPSSSSKRFFDRALDEDPRRRRRGADEAGDGVARRVREDRHGRLDLAEAEGGCGGGVCSQQERVVETVRHVRLVARRSPAHAASSSPSRAPPAAAAPARAPASPASCRRKAGRPLRGSRPGRRACGRTRRRRSPSLPRRPRCRGRAVRCTRRSSRTRPRRRRRAPRPARRTRRGWAPGRTASARRRARARRPRPRSRPGSHAGNP